MQIERRIGRGTGQQWFAKRRVSKNNIENRIISTGRMFPKVWWKKRYDARANKFYDQEHLQIWIFTNENYSCLGKQTCQTLFVRVPTFLSLVVKSIKREGIPFFFRSQNLSTREKIRAKDVISIQRKLKSIIKYERISFFFSIIKFVYAWKNSNERRNFDSYNQTYISNI